MAESSCPRQRYVHSGVFITRAAQADQIRFICFSGILGYPRVIVLACHLDHVRGDTDLTA